MLNQGFSQINCCLTEYYWIKELDEAISNFLVSSYLINKPVVNSEYNIINRQESYSVF